MNNSGDPSLALDFEDTTISRFHWRMVVTAGMGFFTDAYDLFIIGVVTAILAPIWHLSIGQLAMLNAASLAAAAVGAVCFGSLSDKFGRTKLYGLEVAILFVGAILSAVAPSFTWLLISRIIVGLGIGGDYPSSAVVASEHSTRKKRGFLVLLVFAMQALGLIVGPMFASFLLATGMGHDLVWRVLLGVGAIPAASVFYLRRTLKESPHFKLSNQSPLEVSRVVHDLTVDDNAAVNVRGYQKQKLFSGKWLKCLIGTAGAWFLLDVAFYGNGISSVIIMRHITPHADLLQHTLISAMIFMIFAVPGYFVAAKYVDKLGRKPIQMFGFGVMALAYGLIALMPNPGEILPAFILTFGISFFFVNFGPNATTFLIPSEIYPTSIRAKAHGISAAVGKIGAFVGAFLLPLILHKLGLNITMALMAVVAILGIIVTTLIPEMKDKSLSATEDFVT
jgi:MFS transporter, PHS family, inorganic phosphate transporter